MSNKLPGILKPSERTALIALLNGVRVGQVLQGANGTIRFVYDEAWRHDVDAYPLSLSMPLTASEHRHDTISAFLWGLLPDNHQTLEHYGRLFSVSSNNPVALLSHIGADCAGAVQFATPENVGALQASTSIAGSVQWLDDEEIAQALRSVRQNGIPGNSIRTVGQFSLAGAQPKIALLEHGVKWGMPSGRTPTNRILKPPSGAFKGFAENEHFCLELARALALGSVTSRVTTFAGEMAIVVERFDRIKRGAQYHRIHQEDICQALAVMPMRKYENEGGPGIVDIVSVIRDASLKPDEDIDRFIGATALNWVITATDAHAKNYALLHNPGGGVRLAPFYDILSYLPYADASLHRVKLAMRIGSKYLIRQVGRTQWEALARANALSPDRLFSNIGSVLEQIPMAVGAVTDASIASGLDAAVVTQLRNRILRRTKECARMLS